jgi:predicted permease
LAVLDLVLPNGDDIGFSATALADWLERLRTVDGAAGYFRKEVTIRAGVQSAVVPAAIVTDGFFDVLGMPAEVGETHSQADSSLPVIIGRRSLHLIPVAAGSDPVGTSLFVSDEHHILGGVMPPDFSFPDDEIAVWLPGSISRAGRLGFAKIVARLKPGVTLEQLREDADRVRLELNPNSRQIASVTLVGQSVVENLRPLMTAAIAGALLVLLVACANVATLFLGRNVRRERELAARMALGATAPQLVRGVLIEALLLAVIASLVGIGVGAAALQVFVAQASGTIAGLHRADMAFPVVAAVGALTLLVTLACGAMPAWHALRVEFGPFLRMSSDSRPRAWRIRGALVVAQIALACVLLIGAGLLTRTVQVLMNEDHGFHPENAMEAKVVLSDTVIFEGREAFVRDLVDRIRAIPGVQHAGFGTTLPARTPPLSIAIRFVSDTRDEALFLHTGSVTPGYLRAMGARFIGGRDFEERDSQPGSAAVILSESAARFLFPTENPIGRTFTRLPPLLGITGAPRVVGIVSDIKYESLDSPARSAVYVPWTKRPLGTGYLIVRAAGDPTRFASDIRRTVQELDPSVPVTELQSIREALAGSIANRTVRALPAVGFGLLALGVAFVGLLATLSTLVAERRRDLAIRSALGASPRQLVWTILGRGLALTAAGLLVGLGLGAAAARGLAVLLYDISPYDFMTFAGAASLIAVGAIVSSYLAAVRARSVDPIAVLRSD